MPKGTQRLDKLTEANLRRGVEWIKTTLRHFWEMIQNTWKIKREEKWTKQLATECNSVSSHAACSICTSSTSLVNSWHVFLTDRWLNSFLLFHWVVSKYSGTQHTPAFVLALPGAPSDTTVWVCYTVSSLRCRIKLLWDSQCKASCLRES